MNLSSWMLVLGVLFLAATARVGHCNDAVDPKARVLKLFADEFVPLTPGKGKFPASFKMGAASDDEGPYPSEKPQVTVTFKTSFAMAKHEVTQELYEAITGKNPAKWKGHRNSVEIVSWDDANAFCRTATEELRKRKHLGENEVIRLPSEAEWEYACRAGTTTKWSCGDKLEDLRDHAWFRANSKGVDPPVGSKKPNPWGLFDMHGYIWEWTADAWSPSHEGAPTDGSPRGGKDVEKRVVRGGAYDSTADECRSAYRAAQPVGYQSDTLGFRCVKAAK